MMMTKIISDWQNLQNKLKERFETEMDHDAIFQGRGRCGDFAGRFWRRDGRLTLSQGRPRLESGPAAPARFRARAGRRPDGLPRSWLCRRKAPLHSPREIYYATDFFDGRRTIEHPAQPIVGQCPKTVFDGGIANVAHRCTTGD